MKYDILLPVETIDRNVQLAVRATVYMATWIIIRSDQRSLKPDQIKEAERYRER